jgi:hypothetical protein
LIKEKPIIITRFTVQGISATIADAEIRICTITYAKFCRRERICFFSQYLVQYCKKDGREGVHRWARSKLWIFVKDEYCKDVKLKGAEYIL